MHSVDLILTLTGALAAAAVGGFVTHRLGLSPIVGYLFAGMAVGPHTPGFVADQPLAGQLAEIGVVLLMFGVGLQFHVEDLLAVRRVVVPGALVASGCATLLGALGTRAFGWSWGAALVFGVAMSVASTVVLIRVLSDNRDLQTRTGHLAVGWLVVEDLLAVLVLVLMPAVVRAGGGTSALVSVVIAIVKVVLAIVLTIAVGGRAIPWLLDRVAAARSRELFTLSVLTIALGLAVTSALAFGVSMALGAFLAGLVVGRSDFSIRAATDALPMRDAFAVLFFVSVGMLLDPAALLREPALLGLTLAVILVGKPLAALAALALLRYPWTIGAPVVAALAQIGEFSFIVGRLGTDLGVVPTGATNTLIAAAIVSITLNPVLYRAARSRVFSRRATAAAAPAALSDRAPLAERVPRAIVVGAGPIGRTATRLLQENGVQPTVIELNMETVRHMRASGVDAVYGDAAQTATLVAANVQLARFLIISVAGMTGTAETIRIARELNPDIRILVRTAYLREVAPLRQAGADFVFSGEGEVALAMTEAVLRALGATSEQIERERARGRAELG
jgi:K+:H+ antiporter